MALQGWYVKQVARKEITDFIETWHYSGSINGCIADYCYALFSPDDKMCGGMFYGRMAMAGQWKRFRENGAETESDVIELRRLACIDDTPRNAESFFISRTIKLLRKAWEGKLIVSYADKEYNHSGTIYKASNFTKIGDIAGAKVIVTNEGRRYHDKAIRTKYKGELKPFAKRLIVKLEDGTAHFAKTKGKHTYLYEL